MNLNRFRQFGIGPIGMVLLLTAIPAPAGADVAHLRSGATLDIIGFTVDRGWVVLDLAGGGQMALPQDQIVEIRRTETPIAEPHRGLPTEETRRLPSAAETLTSEPAPITAESPRDAAARGTGAAPGPGADRSAFVDLASRIAREHDVAVDLVLAVIHVESSYDPRAVSPRGAVGLMQLMPRTARRFDVRDPLDPQENVKGGVLYLKELLDRYSGQVRLALAAYNAGEEAVERFGGIPPYRETIQYVERILREMKR